MARCVNLDRLVHSVFQRVRCRPQQVLLARTVCQEWGDPRVRRLLEQLNVVAEREVVQFNEQGDHIECVLFALLLVV